MKKTLSTETFYKDWALLGLEIGRKQKNRSSVKIVYMKNK